MISHIILPNINHQRNVKLNFKILLKKLINFLAKVSDVSKKRKKKSIKDFQLSPRCLKLNYNVCREIFLKSENERDIVILNLKRSLYIELFVFLL